jgi:hypothetical protein
VAYFTQKQADSDVADAVAASNAAGQPTGSAIYFTVDYDAPQSDIKAVTSYFEEVRKTLGSRWEFTRLVEYYWRSCMILK